jgi:F420-dependent oxidoreductase-like protein
MRVALMIEGQEDVTWDEWQALATACEDGGYDALFRSDHYMSLMGHPPRAALDAWATLSALAAVTSTLRLGTLVSPATFRHPSELAKVVTTADHVSEGRVELGMGAGWNEREHAAYGFPFPELGERFDRLEEQVEVVRRSMSEDVVDFTGEHYTLEALEARPRPVQTPVPLLIGGALGPRSARLAARWADEYNSIGAGVDELPQRRDRLERACRDAGRDPIPLSIMTGTIVGRDRDEVAERARAVVGRISADLDVDEFLAARQDSWIIGTVDEVVERIRAYEAVGVSRVMLQHLDHRDLDAVGLIADEVIPAVR